MKRTETVIIGGGQAGLAMSRCLSERGIDHVVLERGRVGQRWRTERWDSLRLLTPNWQSRLPGWQYQGSDPDGYMTMPEVIRFLESYADSFSAPIQDETSVESLERNESGYVTRTDAGTWRSSTVVLATGYSDVPFVPPMGRNLKRETLQIVPSEYRNPSQLPSGGVLVVGASSTGIQLAQEIQSSGRPVTLAVGRHNRLPRCYRGKDILWWLDRMGVLDQPVDDVYDINISRGQPSLQLVGRPDRGSLNLETLEAEGVRLAGRLEGIDGARVRFDDDLIANTISADAKLATLLQRIDRFAEKTGLNEMAEEPEPFSPFMWPNPAPAEINLSTEGIRTVLWATGFRRAYPWLKVPVLDRRGEIQHNKGVTASDGLYVVGMQFLRKRNSAFIDGVGADAIALAQQINGQLRQRSSAA